MIRLKWMVTALLAGLTSLPMLAAAQSAIDGRWKSKDSDEIVTFKTEGDRVTMAASTGVGYTARLDRSDAPVKGDKVVDTVSVSMPDKRTLVSDTGVVVITWPGVDLKARRPGYRAVHEPGRSVDSTGTQAGWQRVGEPARRATAAAAGCNPSRAPRPR